MLRLYEKGLIAYLLFTGVAIVLLTEQSQRGLAYLLVHSLAALGIVFLASLKGAKLIPFLRDWYLIPFFLVLYSELGMIHSMLYSSYYDDWVIALEEAVFGSLPPLWLAETVSSPLLADLFSLGYLSYYFIFPVVAIVLYLKQDKTPFYHFLFALTGGFLSCYLIYFFFPASGPPFVFSSVAVSDVQGYWITQLTTSLHGGSVRAAAFPSSHVALSIIAILFAFRYTPKAAKVLLPFVVLLVPATVYGKYHFGVDALAGLLWGFLIGWLTLKTWPLLSRSADIDTPSSNQVS